MKKVYCDECKFVAVNMYQNRLCDKKKEWRDTPTSREAVYPCCENANSANDCTEFAPKWWVRVWWFLRGLFK